MRLKLGDTFAIGLALGILFGIMIHSTSVSEAVDIHALQAQDMGMEARCDE